MALRSNFSLQNLISAELINKFIELWSLGRGNLTVSLTRSHSHCRSRGCTESMTPYTYWRLVGMHTARTNGSGSVSDIPTTGDWRSSTWPDVTRAIMSVKWRRTLPGWRRCFSRSQVRHWHLLWDTMNSKSLILGVRILLRVWDQVMGFFIRLRNVTIVG
jgi:hypothetical protein